MVAFDGCAGQLRCRMSHLKHLRVPTAAACSALRFAARDVLVPTGIYVLDLYMAWLFAASFLGRARSLAGLLFPLWYS